LQSCDVLLALIGPRWLAVADRNGNPRLADPGDFVRVEIEAGLERDDVAVIPVLVQEAEMPGAADVPGSMVALTRRNAFELSDNRWRSDIERLVLAMERVAAEKREREAREKEEREAAARGERDADGEPPPGELRRAPRNRWAYLLSVSVVLVAFVVFYAVSRAGTPARQSGHGPPPTTPSPRSSHPPKSRAEILPTKARVNMSAKSSKYENPLIVVNAPDPTLIRAQGKYYAYTTQNNDGATHMPRLESNDLIRWSSLGDALKKLPAWADHTSSGDTWAPDAIRFKGRYYLYFSERLKSKDMGIAVQDSSSPQGPFHVLGGPLIHGPGYADIDPFVLQRPNGRLLLYWGSDRQPIRVSRLSADGTSLVGPKTAVLSTSSATSYDDQIEGADVFHHGHFFYLFYSGDRCCGPEAHYAELVARSHSPTGPFDRDPNNPVIQANAAFKAPGHGTVFADAAGTDFILYHAMDQSDPNQLRYLMLDRIDWKGGWPVVNDGNGPSSTPQPRPQVGT
jgi:arabinan endo-1,5-alpha-L-arabinosidase